MKLRVYNLGMSLLCVALIVTVVIGLHPPAWAVPYYEVGDSNLATGNQSLRFMYASGTKQLLFPSNIQNLVTGPSGDAMLADSVTQSISQTYSFSSQASSGVYNLTPSGVSDITLAGSGTYFTAEVTALQVNFNDHTISWSGVTNPTFNNTIDSQALTDLALATTYAFTSFTFQTLTNEANWLAGTDTKTKNVQYYAKLEGFTAVPEPATWLFLCCGLIGWGIIMKVRVVPV